MRETEREKERERDRERDRERENGRDRERARRREEIYQLAREYVFSLIPSNVHNTIICISPFDDTLEFFHINDNENILFDLF